MNRMNLSKNHNQNETPEQPRRVLIMDDTLLIRENLSKMLRHLGYDVIEASEGGEAIEKVKNLMEHSTISLAILDLYVPSGIDGAATAIRLREMNPSMRIIIATGSPESEFSQKLQNVKVDGILLKPYSLEELKAVLASVEHKNGKVLDLGDGEAND